MNTFGDHDHTPHTTHHSRRCWLVESWRRQIIWERRFFHISSSISQLDLSILSDLYEWDPDRIKYKIYKVYTGPIGFTKTYFSIANKQFEVIQKEERTPILNFCVTGEDFIKIKWKHKIKDLEKFPFIFDQMEWNFTLRTRLHLFPSLVLSARLQPDRYNGNIF